MWWNKKIVDKIKLRSYKEFVNHNLRFQKIFLYFYDELYSETKYWTIPKGCRTKEFVIILKLKSFFYHFIMI